MRRGFTLIELMIVVALLGIAAAGAIGTAAQLHRQQASAELQRARAEVLLQYLAGARAAGRQPDGEVVQRLLAELPGAQVAFKRGQGVETCEVRWRPASGPAAALSLAVIAR